MQPSEVIRRLSDELARDPASRSFLALAHLLAESGRTEAALRIARQGAARHPASAEARELVARLESVRERAPRPAATAQRDAGTAGGPDSGAVLGELLVSPEAVLAAGWDGDADGRAAGVAAELGAMADGADRALAHLALGSWRRILVEGDGAVVAMAPALDGFVAAAAPVGAPLGRLTLLLREARERYGAWRRPA